MRKFCGIVQVKVCVTIFLHTLYATDAIEELRMAYENRISLSLSFFLCFVMVWQEKKWCRNVKREKKTFFYIGDENDDAHSFVNTN